MDIYRNTRTGKYILGDGETVTEYSLSQNGEVEKDASASESYYEGGHFPPSYFEVVTLGEIPGAIAEQIEADLDL